MSDNSSYSESDLNLPEVLRTKQHIHAVPEGYFDAMPAKAIATIEGHRQKASSPWQSFLSLPLLRPVLAVSIAFVLTIGLYYTVESNNSSELPAVANDSSNSIYLDYLEVDDLLVLAQEQNTLEDTDLLLNDKDIEEYIYDNWQTDALLELL